MVVDRTGGLDRAHADPARSKRADNRMVWTLGQSHCGAQFGGRLLGGLRNAGAAGVDGQTVSQFEAQQKVELAQLREELRQESYRRQAARRVWIPKPGTTEKRPLGIPAVRDRTVEAALKHVLEPIFERDFAEHS